jgi:hypothetical protein
MSATHPAQTKGPHTRRRKDPRPPSRLPPLAGLYTHGRTETGGDARTRIAHNVQRRTGSRRNCMERRATYTAERSRTRRVWRRFARRRVWLCPARAASAMPCSDAAESARPPPTSHYPDGDRMTRINGRAWSLQRPQARPLSAAMHLRTVHKSHIDRAQSARRRLGFERRLLSCATVAAGLRDPPRAHKHSNAHAACWDQPRGPPRRVATVPDANAHGGRRLLRPGHSQCRVSRSTALE